MFWFMLIALVAVVAAVALAVLGNNTSLSDTEPDRLNDPLPVDRPVHPGDIDSLRIAVTMRGYRMSDVDDVLDRLGAELGERDARIAELEATLAGAREEAYGARDEAYGAQPLGRPQFGGPPPVRRPFGGQIHGGRPALGDVPPPPPEGPRQTPPDNWGRQGD